MLKPLAYWPYQSVRVLNVMDEHIYIKKNRECDNSLALCIVYSKRCGKAEWDKECDKQKVGLFDMSPPRAS